MKVLKKKAFKTNIEKIKKTNYDITQFLEFLKEQYPFTDEELNTLNTIDFHLLNMNVLFQQMLDNTEKRK